MTFLMIPCLHPLRKMSPSSRLHGTHKAHSWCVVWEWCFHGFNKFKITHGKVPFQSGMLYSIAQNELFQILCLHCSSQMYCFPCDCCFLFCSSHKLTSHPMVLHHMIVTWPMTTPRHSNPQQKMTIISMVTKHNTVPKTPNKLISKWQGTVRLSYRENLTCWHSHPTNWGPLSQCML